MNISSEFYPYLVILAILQYFRCAESQENDLRGKDLCPKENQLRCYNNQVLDIKEVSLYSNALRCQSPRDVSDCFRQVSEEQKNAVKDGCQDETDCTIDFTSVSSVFEDIRFRCPIKNIPTSSPITQGRSYQLHVEYTCKNLLETAEDFTIVELRTTHRRIEADTTQHVLSPHYPHRMSQESQDITCVFTRSSQPVNENTNVQVNILQLQLNGSKEAEQLTIKSDVRTETSPSYTSPIAIKENIKTPIMEIISVTNNFTMHFNRCTTLRPGGKFNISFAVQTDFEMSCTHAVTECKQTVTSTPVPPPDDEPKPPEDDFNFRVMVGGVAGSLILLLIVVILILCCKLRKKRQQENLPVEKREQRKQPTVGRHSSFGDRASNVYQEIGDNDPPVHYYSEIGHVNTIFEKAKSLDYDSRPAPEIPRINNRPPLDVVDELEPGYDKIKQEKEKAENGVAGYANPKREGSFRKPEDFEEKADSDDSYSKLMESEKLEAVNEINNKYAKLDKAKKGKKKTDKVDEGVEVEHPDFGRIGSEMIMEDNMDLYMSADETEGIKADDVFQNSNNTVNNTSL